MFTANPRGVPNARLLKSLDYDEAQEIASSGAKVLHPRCILPAKQYSIPLSVHATQRPELAGTVITATGGDGGARVKAVCSKKGITLISMDTLGMWHQVGFLADAFAVFKEHGCRWTSCPRRRRPSPFRSTPPRTPSMPARSRRW